VMTQLRRPTIALSLIAKNEAHNIPKLFESIKDCFDEIHLTDTGSTDDTVEVAKQHGFIVHHFKWCDDFSAARNYCLQQIKTDYICWMDLDDLMIGREKFIEFRDTILGKVDCWAVQYEVRENSKIVRERIVKNGVFQWNDFIHETLGPIRRDAKLSFRYTDDFYIKHDRVYHDAASDGGRNLAIFRKKEAEGVKFSPTMLAYYGRELFFAGHGYEALKYIDLCLQEGEVALTKSHKVSSYDIKALIYLRAKEYESAMQACYAGLAVDATHGEFFSILGDCVVGMDRYAEAIPYYTAALACGEVTDLDGPGVLDRKRFAYEEHPIAQIARVYYKLGKLKKAIETCEAGYEKFKTERLRGLLLELRVREAEIDKKEKAKPIEKVMAGEVVEYTG